MTPASVLGIEPASRNMPRASAPREGTRLRAASFRYRSPFSSQALASVGLLFIVSIKLAVSKAMRAIEIDTVARERGTSSMAARASAMRVSVCASPMRPAWSTFWSSW
ncbi:hypothetical protein D3C72_1019840 [compost metagenome]